MRDKATGKEIILTDEDLDLIEKIQQSHYPETTIDPYAVRTSSLAIIMTYIASHMRTCILMKR